MRLGGPIFASANCPEAWIEAVRAEGYRAAFCPLGRDADAGTIAAYAEAARQADIMIAEVGAWSNPVSPDRAVATAAFKTCTESLALADEIGARCCVNIAGSCGSKWDGPHPCNLTAETFDVIVESVRSIIDAVKPVRTFYVLETMPWMYPDSPDAYMRLIKAIDRPAFGVHLDPVNLVCSPQRYFSNRALLDECFRTLGPYIKSCHAKDIFLHDSLTVRLEEVMPGQGMLDYGFYLEALNRLEPDIPLMLEHLSGADAYRAAARHIREVASTKGISL